MGIFSKLKSRVHKGEVVDLVESYRVSEKSSFDGVPTVYYDIFLHENKRKIGRIELRLTVDGDNYYYGNVGYNILRNYRGNGYAYEACKILFDIARDEFKLEELIITCSPENIASYKTLTKLNGELIDLVKVPSNHMLYLVGEKTKYIFRYKIGIE